MLLGLTASTLGVSSNLFHMEKSYWNESECIRIHGQPNFNQTLCSHIRSFRLPQEYYATVCTYGNRTILDISQFLNLKPSIKGISLSITQWSYLLSIRQHITRAMYQLAVKNNPNKGGNKFYVFRLFFMSPSDKDIVN